jgi:hypothetical protein
MNKPPILTAVEAMAKIQIILQEGDIVISDHCKRVRMKERDVTYVDIITCLKKGTINRAAEWEEKYSNWKYRVEGFDKVGEELTSIVVIIDANLELFVITIF